MATTIAPRTRASAPRKVSASPSNFGRDRIVRGVRIATAVHAVVVLALLVLLCGVSEDWWFSTALSYLPRAPYLALSATVIPAVALRLWGLAVVNALCGVLIAGPVMGLCAPIGSNSDNVAATTAGSLLILTCNIQNGDSDLPTLLAEIETLAPDVIACQEVMRGSEVLNEHFAGWHVVDVGEYWVASRFPIRLLDQCEAQATRRKTAILCEISAPDRTWLLCDVHLSTARHGLTDLRWHSPLSGAGVDDLRWRQWQRRLESEETLRFATQDSGRPRIVLGDFNTPTNSSLFRDVWGGWQSAFDQTGWGYGYTSPCNTNRLWPSNTPWLRIDHILCDPGWEVLASGIGQSAGSDHRLMWARVMPDVRIQDSGSGFQGQR